MQSGVIRGHIRNEFITQHSTLSNHRPERMLAHPVRFLSFVSHRFHRFAQIILRCKQRSYTHQVSLQKTPKESKICGNLCNLWENSTFNINHYESKLEIRHQFHHHSPHRRSQLLLYAELRQPLGQRLHCHEKRSLLILQQHNHEESKKNRSDCGTLQCHTC